MRAFALGIMMTLGVAVGTTARGARAQLIPPPESGPPSVQATLIDGTKLELRDIRTHAPIIVSHGLKMPGMVDPAVTSEITLNPQPTGCDLVFTFHNTAEVPKPIGVINIGIITLGPNIVYQDIRNVCAPVDANVETYIGKYYPYPADLYSPLWVLSNDRYHVGVSLQFPMMAYKHDLVAGLSNPKGNLAVGEGGAGFAVRFLLSDIGTNPWEKVPHPASLAPDERRVYVVSIRVQPKDAEWVRTLTPYRDFFRATYGGVKYVRDPKPVLGFGVSDGTYLSDSNPFGYGTEFRPDLRGFETLADKLKDEMTGWNRVMLWLPSGVYRRNPQFNFPSKMATPWLAINQGVPASDPFNGMASVSRSGKELGLWWGNSMHVARQWDPPEIFHFDLTNPEHVRLMLDEIDAAAKSGATAIGMDTFDILHTPIWQAYAWVESMRLRYPYMKFVTEPSACDIMHGLTPTFISAWNDDKPVASVEDLCLIKNPNYLCDFLLPGHEYWAGFRYNGHRAYFGIDPTPAHAQADIQKLAAFGYIPCIQFAENVVSGVLAAKTWETTVPAELRLSDKPDNFGPVADGSTYVGLSTSARPDRPAGRAVAGWKPSPPVVPTEVSGTPVKRSALVRPGKRLTILRPSANHDAQRSSSDAWVVSVPSNPISEAVRRAREAQFGPKPLKIKPIEKTAVGATDLDEARHPDSSKK